MANRYPDLAGVHQAISAGNYPPAKMACTNHKQTETVCLECTCTISVSYEGLCGKFECAGACSATRKKQSFVRCHNCELRISQAKAEILIQQKIIDDEQRKKYRALGLKNN